MMKTLRLRKNEKAPLKAGTFDGEKPDIVRQWMNEGGNYGILTGAINGIAVIDIDNHNDVDGSTNLEEFLEMYDVELPQTLTVETPTGGKHLYFTLPEQYNDTQFLQQHPHLEGVDFQTHGRFVVGWGSQIDGKHYVKSLALPMAQLPQAWIELFKDKSIQNKNKKRERKWTANLLGDIIAGCPEGGRNIWLTTIIGKLFATGLEHDEVWIWAQYCNQIGCTPPLDEDEVLQTFESLKRREERRMSDD